MYLVLSKLLSNLTTIYQSKHELLRELGNYQITIIQEA